MMKSEREFLTSMWSEIDAKEVEVRQKRMVHEINRRLFIGEIFAYGMMIALLGLGGLIAFFAKGNSEIVYGVAVLLFSGAFFTERVYYSKLQGVVVDENGNCH